MEHPYLKDGGLAVLFGNIARNGCIVKTAGVDESILRFEGKARVFESQESACAGILGGKVNAGDVVIIRYEGPKGGPGMQEMLYPTSYLKSVRLDKACALVTDGRFSGGTSGLSIGHVSPEAAAGGDIALVRDDDRIVIDIPNRTIDVVLPEGELDRRPARRSSASNPSGATESSAGPEGLCVDGHVGRPGRSARRHLTKDHSTFYPSAGHPRTTAVPDGSASGRTSDAVKTD